MADKDLNRVVRRDTQDVRIPASQPIQADEIAPSLPANRAFVVQFRSESEAGQLSGRVEHIESGQSARFTSEEELAAFYRHVLAQANSDLTE